MKRLMCLFASVVLMVASGQVLANVLSFKFQDKIKNDGVGTIDLFAPALKEKVSNAATLEAFRQDNNGALVFSVSLNEPNDGSENSESQGVAIESVELTLNYATETVVITDLSTRTYSLLLKKGNTERALYSTIVGDSKSNRTSSDILSEINGSSFDGTLRVPVSRDLRDLVGATFTVRFLVVDRKLPDPEAFYDFAGADEEIALLSSTDAAYLDALAPGRAQAPLTLSASGEALVNWTYYPSNDGYYVASYEDLFPKQGDYDFNDLVVAYRVAMDTNANGEVRQIIGSGYLVARGAAYNHDWRLRMALPSWASGLATYNFYEANSLTPKLGFPKQQWVSGELDLLLAENIAGEFSDGSSTYVNTFHDQAVVEGPRFDFSVVFELPVPFADIEAAPFDPYLYVYDTEYEVHLMGKSPVLRYSRNTQNNLTAFKDENNYPFALVIPDDFAPPLAAIDMGLAYPDYLEYVLSGGTQKTDWFRRPVVERVKKVPFKNW